MTEEVYQSEDATKLAVDVFAGRLTIEEALKRLRTRLLDLSMRNRLLNYKHPKGRSIQFVGAQDLDLLYERLKEDAKPASVAYIPEPHPESYGTGKKPEARHHAASLGYDTSPDFPVPKGGGTSRRLAAVQALMYPADLEKFARKLSSEAHTVVEETGTNMLYLMFGFLEFYDSEDSDRPLLAPLISMPVSLDKGALDHESRTYPYDVSYSGEDVVENFTLREKLKQEFRLQLPEFDEEDTPASYFAKIEQAVSRRRNWKVRRRLSIGFLSFGKLAIWADLDPAKAASLLTNPLLRSIFEGGNSGSSEAFHAEDYVVDKHPAAELPLIYDADSSQHSAIIDVLDGKNLVINGPPGTGKSQTITNIIAAAMSQGKKVLFVSEKLAALEVVKQRLERAGLGEFCLELHSNKTLKKQLLEGLGERIKRRFPAPIGYESQVEVLRERRKTLNAYAELLGSRDGNGIDKTAHQILWAAERRRAQLGDVTEIVSDISLADAKNWTAEQFDRRRMVMALAAAAARDLACPVSESPWVGFTPNLLVRGDELPIVAGLRQALAHAEGMAAIAASLGEHVGRSDWTTQELTRLNDGLSQLTLDPDVRADLLHSMYAGRMHEMTAVKVDAEEFIESLGTLRRLVHAASQIVLPGATPDEHKFRRFNAGIRERLSSSAMGRSANELQDWAAKLSAFVEKAQALHSAAMSVFCAEPAKTLGELNALLGAQGTLAYVGDPSQAIAIAAVEALETCRAVAAVHQQVNSILAAGGIKMTGRLDVIRGYLEGKGFGELSPSADISTDLLAALKGLENEGFEAWTAERFASTSRDVQENVSAGQGAIQGLQDICERVAVPFDSTVAGLEALEALLKIAETAPHDLLSYRSKSFEAPTFSETAMQAEETHRLVQKLSSKVHEHFHVDTLPDTVAAKESVRVFRRGDSYFNFLKSDWRAAKGAFEGSYKNKGKFNAKEMEERMALVLRWRQTTSEFEGSGPLKERLGSLFDGTRTDFAKIRRLHEWYRISAQVKLQHWVLAENLELTSVHEGRLNELAAQAFRIRTWIKALLQARQLPATLLGVDPALANLKRAEDVLPHLSAFAQKASSTADLLRLAARAGTTVGRVRDLAELRLKVLGNPAPMLSLVEAPTRLAAAAHRIGFNTCPDAKEDVSLAINAVKDAASRAAQIAQLVIASLGGGVSPLTSQKFLSATADLARHAEVHGAQALETPTVDWGDFFRKNGELAGTTSEMAEFLVANTRSGISAETALQGIKARLDSVEAEEAITEHEGYIQRFGLIVQGASTNERLVHACLDWADSVSSVQPRLPPAVASLLLTDRAPTVLDAAQRLSQDAVTAFAAYEQQMKELDDVGTLDWNVWGGSPTPWHAVARLQRALAGSEVLVAWSRYLAAREDAEALGLIPLVQRLERGRLSPEALPAAFDFIFYRSLAKSLVSSSRVLARFSGTGHDQLRKEFAELDKGLIKLNGSEYASRIDKGKKVHIGVNVGRAGDLTEMSLITREINKQRKHIPIRQLLKRAGVSIQALKPCFMMGPLSVAQYLEQGHLSFDLVVMDEASQLRPEDALGAVARGAQLVVVGDPKQLPPTNFFDRLMDGDDEEDEDSQSVTDGVESILGICEHLYRPVRTLRWHYRSQHESLIAFSNHQFYGGRLVVFPSPYKRNRRLGVVYRYVKDGIYQDRKNLPEANRLVDAVIDHMVANPSESLGVVTLNQTQRDLILDLFDRKMRMVKGVSEFMEHHEAEGWKVFVKNLENVQGDERDVIFVSTTFGKPPGGNAPRKNFGPINRADGWRRLNVLFTRSRRRLEVFSSMLPSDIQVDEKTPLGRKALRDYLEFARTGVLPAPAPEVGTRDADSDFEVSVMEALRQHNFECEPQVGVAGFFIDVGVRNPDRRGEFLAGIECDGATYHSSLSARDRDRIRQEVLESLGWRGRIIRIWSTDWFADPRAQMARVLKFLEERRAASAAEGLVHSDGDLEVFEESEGGVEVPAPVVAAETTQDFESSRSGVDDAFVEVGDRVTYVVLESPDERHTVQIVDSASNARLGILNEDTPVARALIGLGNGDDSELHVPGQPVRHLRLIKIHREGEGNAAL